MEILVDSKNVELVNKNDFTLLLTEDGNRIIPLTHDIQSIHMTIPENIVEVNAVIFGRAIPIYRKGDVAIMDFTIYTSLLKYAHVGIQFIFDDENWWPITLTRFDEEIDETEQITIIDGGGNYHTGNRVKYKIVEYEGKTKMVTMPKILFKLVPGIVQDINTNVRVPFREFLTYIDPAYKERLEKLNIGLTMVDETSGYVTNYLSYRNGLAGVEYVF